jgi:hypothetical protein
MTCWCRNLSLTLLVCPTLINLPTVYQNILDLRGNKHLKNRNIHNLYFENVFKKVSTNLLPIPTFGQQYTAMVLK